MAASREVQGQGASAGVACGPAHVSVDHAHDFPPQVSVAIERQNLADAVGVAIAELENLGRRSDAESAAILDFQVEMLMDEELVELAYSRIAAGDSAALAWASGLDAYIADVELSDDSFLAARAVDIVDIRNRVLAGLAGQPVADFPDGSIFVGQDLAPSLFLAHDWSKGGGIALTAGSTVSHVALLARANAVPMVVGLGNIDAESGEPILLDGNQGRAIINPPEGAIPAHYADVDPEFGGVAGSGVTGAAYTADGVSIALRLNINDTGDLDRINVDAADGIGLVRTEFMMTTPADAINEDRQYEWYRRVLGWAGDRPVTIRMLDLGGDKTMAGLGGAEDMSFLGVRGIRFLLARPEIARAQARALMRAAVDGNLRVLLPMVTVASELAAMADIFREEAANLTRRGFAHAVPPLGIMVEVPATALTLDLFAEAAFFSFGTNDLAQYLAAAARDNADIAHLHRQAETALFRLLGQALAMAGDMGVPVSICGDMAGDPAYSARLLACGIRDFSMAPGRLVPVRSAISTLNADGSAMAGV